jgi:DNA-binding NarL/FixJ family response regulator
MPKRKMKVGGNALCSRTEHKPHSAGPGQDNRIRVLIAEDHTVVRDGLVAILGQEGDIQVVAETGNGRQAVDLWKAQKPDVTLMDLKMPGMDGVNAIEMIRALDPNARIVILTTFDGDEDIYRGIRAGAKAYLLKDVGREELCYCIREVHSGKMFLPAEIVIKLAQRRPAEELSARELEVLKLLAQGKPNKLIGAVLFIGEVTVKSHVQSIFRKLNVLSRTEAIAVATRKGLLRSLSD